MLGGLGEADLPALRRLRIGGFTRIGDEPDLSPFADATGMPGVEILRLGRMRAEIEEPLCAALLGSALLHRIARLEIEWFERPTGHPRLAARNTALALGRAQVVAIREYSELFCAQL